MSAYEKGTGDLRTEQSTYIGNTSTSLDDIPTEETVGIDQSMLVSDLNPNMRKSQGIHIHFTTVNEPMRVATREGTNITAIPDDTMCDVRQLQTTTYLTNNLASRLPTKEEAVQTQSSAFPTDSRMKAKKKDEALKAMGLDPKLLRQRKEISQESHYDDCGFDFGGIDESKATVTFADAVY